MNIPKKWHNIDDLDGYVVEESQYGFYGRLVDKNNKSISILGMSQSNIGYSINKQVTEEITKRNFKEVMKIIQTKN